VADEITPINSPASSDDFNKYFREYMMQDILNKPPEEEKIEGSEVDEGLPEETGIDRLVGLAEAYGSGGETAAREYIDATRVSPDVVPPCASSPSNK
jgi:pantothenate kinase type III